MTPFADIWERAVLRHGEDELKRRFPSVKSSAELEAMGDDRFLAAMTKRVFAAGFRWKVIEMKWDGFEEAFAGFDPAAVAAYDDARVGQLAADTRIVRNKSKILSTIDNAAFVQSIAREHGSFGAWLAAWPSTDVIGLWAALKEGGNRLGGDTGAWFLRLVGKDTFRISSDVSTALIDAGVVPKKPSGKRAMAEVQRAFNSWHEESGLPMAHISLVLACSAGDVYS